MVSISQSESAILLLDDPLLVGSVDARLYECPIANSTYASGMKIGFMMAIFNGIDYTSGEKIIT